MATGYSNALKGTGIPADERTKSSQELKAVFKVVLRSGKYRSYDHHWPHGPEISMYKWILMEAMQY